MNTVKKNVTLLLALCLCIALPLALASCMKHIEDTNGADDHSLTTLTDADLVKGAASSITTSMVQSTINGKTTVKVGKLSGVTQLDKFKPFSDKVLVYTATVTSGNLRLVLVREGQIVAELPADGGEHIVPLLQEAGSVLLRAAGESAAFKLTYEVKDWPSDWDVNA